MDQVPGPSAEMLDVEMMARAIVEHEGGSLEPDSKEAFFRSLVKLAQHAPLHLEGRYGAISEPKATLVSFALQERNQR